jgi:hypothetical protein
MMHTQQQRRLRSFDLSYYDTTTSTWVKALTTASAVFDNTKAASPVYKHRPGTPKCTGQDCWVEIPFPQAIASSWRIDNMNNRDAGGYQSQIFIFDVKFTHIASTVSTYNTRRVAAQLPKDSPYTILR